MADNFNLRTFLTENKLTKNAKLLKEEESQHSYEDELYDKISEQWDIAGLHGAPTTVHCNYGRNDWKTEKFANGDDAIWFLVDQANEGDVVSFEQARELEQWWDEGEMEEPLPQLGVLIGETGEFYITQKAEENIDEAQFSDSYDTPAAKKVHGQLTDIVDIFEKSRDQETQELNAAIAAAEQETGTQVTPTERRVLQQQASWIRTRRSEMEREGTENKKPIMKETKLTAKERRLVEMVNNAMGMEEENVDYTMGRQDDPNQLPNPAPELNIPEGEDVVQEKPMPKYESIDQLMKEIEHGTNEAAHKYKMEEMKRIYELLETKVTSLEEGENAEHIDQSKVKQMRKDIAALRKAEEKLRKEFEKKFNKKEKPAAAPKAEKEAATEAASEAASEALQEGTFNLRKFLTENKLTAGSRMLNENADISREDFLRGLAAELKQQGFPNVSKILNDKTGMGSFDQGAWYSNTSDCMLDDEVIEEVEPIISDYCDEKGVEFVS